MKQNTKRILSIILILLVVASGIAIVLSSLPPSVPPFPQDAKIVMYQCTILECNETYLQEKNTTITHLNDTFLDQYPKYKKCFETAFNQSAKQYGWKENLRLISGFQDLDLVYPDFLEFFSEEELESNQPVYEYRGKYFIIYALPTPGRTGYYV